MNRGTGVRGFVLAGGKSSRMGSDKARLPYNGRTLAQYIASELSQVVDAVFLVGDPALYGDLGYRVIPDKRRNQGPLSGIEAALSAEVAGTWNFIVACDMPRVTASLFQQIYDLAQRAKPEVECVVPAVGGRIQPLCAVYRQECAFQVTKALDSGTRRVVDVVGMLQAEVWPIAETSQFQNVNTGPEWIQFLEQQQARTYDDRRISTLS